jgi:hypothetical protein
MEELGECGLGRDWISLLLLIELLIKGSLVTCAKEKVSEVGWAG